MNCLNLSKFIIATTFRLFFGTQSFSVIPKSTNIPQIKVIPVVQQEHDDHEAFHKYWSCGFRAIFNATRICSHLLEHESVADIVLSGKEIKREYRLWERDDVWKRQFYASKYTVGSECFKRGEWLDIHDIRNFFKLKMDENSIDFLNIQPIVIGARDLNKKHRNFFKTSDPVRMNEKIKNFREAETGHLIVIFNPKDHYITYVFEKKAGNYSVYKFDSIDGYKDTQYKSLQKFLFSDELTVYDPNAEPVIDGDAEVIELSDDEEVVATGKKQSVKRKAPSQATTCSPKKKKEEAVIILDDEDDEVEVIE